jgi:hypothetical protein
MPVLSLQACCISLIVKQTHRKATVEEGHFQPGIDYRKCVSDYPDKILFSFTFINHIVADENRMRKLRLPPKILERCLNFRWAIERKLIFDEITEQIQFDTFSLARLSEIILPRPIFDDFDWIYDNAYIRNKFLFIISEHPKAERGRLVSLGNQVRRQGKKDRYSMVHIISCYTGL